MNIIITGCGRSGTSPVNEILHSHPDILSTNELGTYFTKSNYAMSKIHDKKTNLYYYINKHKTIDNEAFIKEIKPEFKTNDIIDLFRKHTKEPFKHYCDKDHGYTMEMNDVIKNAGDDCKIIICMRDPRDVLCSRIKYYNMPKDICPWKDELPFWVKPTIEEALKDGLWLPKMQELDKFLSKTKRDFYIVLFSDLCKNPDIVQEELGLYLGLDLEDAFKNVEIKTSVDEQWKTISPDIKLPQEWIDIANKYNLLR